MNDLIRGLSEVNECEAKQATCVDRVQSLSDTLTAKRSRLERQLSEINDALASLAEYPGVEKVLNQIAKVNRY